MPQKITTKEKEELQHLIQEFKQQAIEIARQAKVKHAQMVYLHEHRFILTPAYFAWRVGSWLGLPTAVVGWVIGNGDVTRIGLFLFGVGVWLLVMAVIVLGPGFNRVTKQAKAEIDKKISEIEN